MSIQKLVASNTETAVRGMHDYLGSSAVFTKAEREAGERVNKLAAEALHTMQSKKTSLEYTRFDALVEAAQDASEPVVKVARSVADGYTSPFAVVNETATKTLLHEAKKPEVGAKLDIIEGHMFG